MSLLLRLTILDTGIVLLRTTGGHLQLVLQFCKSNNKRLGAACLYKRGEQYKLDFNPALKGRNDVCIWNTSRGIWSCMEDEVVFLSFLNLRSLQW